MPSNESPQSQPPKMKLIAIFFIALGIVLLIMGQIWAAPVVFTLGLGLIVREWLFRGSQPDGGGRTVVENPLIKIPPPSGFEPLPASPATYTISVRNLPLSRLVAVIIIVILAFIDATVFRAPIVDRYNPIGSWQILMGPTLFYPMVFLPLVMAIGMVLHMLFTIRTITLTRTGHIITIQEQGLLRFTNHIDLTHIVESHYCSNATGLKALWLIPWSIQIWGNFASAWHYVMNEFTFGTGQFIGPAYLAHSIIYFLILLLLLYAPENELRWETKTQECYLRWYPRRLRSTISIKELAAFLYNDFHPLQLDNFLQENSENEHHSDQNSRENLKSLHFYLNLGAFLFILPFVSIAIPFLFNDVIRIFIFIGAIASLGVALKDLSVKTPGRNPLRYTHFKPPHVNPPMLHHPSHPTPLGFMLYLSQWTQILSIGLILTTKWRLYPILSSSSWVIWADLLASTLLGIFLVWLYLKRQWAILGENNRAVQVGGIFCLGVGIVLSFFL